MSCCLLRRNTIKFITLPKRGKSFDCLAMVLLLLLLSYRFFRPVGNKIKYIKRSPPNVKRGKIATIQYMISYEPQCSDH